MKKKSASKKISSKKIEKSGKEEIDFSFIEKKWQKEWEKKRVFEVDADKKKKYYVLEMFPYPSGAGLHMGHALNYTIGDIYARFKRMNGNNVLYPMGYDAFGLPAENAAIKAGEHPKKYTQNSIANFIQQQKALGLSYDWTRMIKTCEKEYYKWNQFFFLKFLENGLVYRKKAPVNWCEKCKTVLANEQVHNGKCWRHEDTNVDIKELEQWFIKITEYAEELYDNIPSLNWPDRIKIMQKNWIQKKEWIDMDYKIDGTDKIVTVSTTRPDTNFGATFVVIAPEHPLLSEKEGLIPDKNRKEINNYIKAAAKKTSEERVEEGRVKTGVFTGLYCINQLTGKKMPLWVTDFVLMDVGTGVVVGVPGHDIRDFEFAKQFGIPIVRVVVGSDGDKSPITKKEQVQEEEGIIINSDFLNGLDIHKATKKIMDYLENKGFGRRTWRYKLRNWLISRQRYWGTPIPVVYCDKCGIVPVNEKDLPVILPDKVKFGEGNPLETNKKFIETKCPKCRGKGRRETDTMDTFFDSSWYFLRYCDNKNSKNAFDKKKTEYWMPVDQYIGGAEHACMHLIYARFFIKALRDLGFVKIDEPFTKLFNQGMLHGEDGNKMSKSLGNVVNPIEKINEYSADALRFNLMSLAAPDSNSIWSDRGLESSMSFLKKVYNYFNNLKFGKSGKRVESKINKAIKEITEDIENFKYNMALIKLRDIFSVLSEEEVSKKDLESFIKILSVFCPHISEEIWHKMRNKSFVSLEKWPVADLSKIDENLEKEEKEIDRTIEDIRNILKIIKEKQGKEGKKVFMYVLPNEVEKYKKIKSKIESSLNVIVEIYAVNDKNKYDPENKSGKVKPGRAGIYIE